MGTPFQCRGPSSHQSLKGPWLAPLAPQVRMSPGHSRCAHYSTEVRGRRTELGFRRSCGRAVNRSHVNRPGAAPLHVALDGVGHRLALREILEGHALDRERAEEHGDAAPSRPHPSQPLTRQQLGYGSMRHPSLPSMMKLHDAPAAVAPRSATVRDVVVTACDRRPGGPPPTPYAPAESARDSPGP